MGMKADVLNRLMFYGVVLMTPLFCRQQRIPEDPEFSKNKITFDFAETAKTATKKVMLKPLERGDTIALFAPGYPVHANPGEAWERLMETKNDLKRRGYHVVIPEQTAKVRYGHAYAGSAEDREQTLNDLIRDPTIAAIWCPQGGQGTTHIDVNKLDLEALMRKPKIMAGFSDFTALSLKLFEKGIPTLHGPIATYVRPLQSRYATAERQRSIQHFFAVAGGKIKPGDPLLDPAFVRDLRPNDTTRQKCAEGVLIGGNLSRFMSGGMDLWMKDVDDVILFVEDLDEELRRYDEMLVTLAQRGAFKNVRGVIIGHFTARNSSSLSVRHKDIKSMILDYMPPGIPVMFAPIGHAHQNMTMQVGARVGMDPSDRRKLYMVEPVVQPNLQYARADTDTLVMGGGPR